MMKTPRVLAAVAALALFAACEKTPPPASLPSPPTITQFAAEKTRLEPGESVKLSFTAENATEAQIVDQTGARLELAGSATQGEVTVTPGETSFYVLTVSGEGGRASAFVQVAVGEALKSVFLVAVPPEIDSGESAQLLWSAFGAKSAKIQTTGGEEIVLDASAGTGIHDVTPARTEAYSLVASGVGSEPSTDTAELRVRAVLADFQVAPSAAKAGETITLGWQTRGADEVVLSEATFGELHRVTVATGSTDVDQGSRTWTIPTELPSGAPVLQGHPLTFTITVKQTNPDNTLTRTVTSFVGDGPVIVRFDAPPAATVGKTITLSWRTANATRLQIFANGGLIYEPLPRNTTVVTEGTLALMAPSTDTTFKLVAYGHENTSASSTHLVKAVSPPSIDTFTLPMQIPAAGDPAKAEWTTQNATRVVLRVKNGSAVFTTADAAIVAAGTEDVLPGVRSTFVLEAFNAAGDVATAEKTVEVGAPGVMTASPAPVTSGEQVTVQWSLDPATTAQVIGDPLQQPLKNNPALDFYDLDGHVDAATILFKNPNETLTRLDLGAPFLFPLVGRVADAFYVSTNGFIAFEDVGPLPQNHPLDSTTEAIPTLVAPFWDDLQLGPNGEVRYLLEGQSFPRRLIVQWNKVQLTEGTELTFQAQLWETGELRFGYKTLSGPESAGESASIGWRLASGFGVERAVAAGASLVPGDELMFFGAGAVAGQFDVVPDGASVFTIFAKQPNGRYVVYPARANVIVPGSVVINEAMVLPDASATNGRWVELYNTTDAAIDLSGVKLTSAATLTEFVIPEGIVLPGGAYGVFGESDDPTLNGGAPVEFTWTGFTPDSANDDTLTLEAVKPISQLGYTAASIVAGTSLLSPQAAIDATGGPLACATRTVTFGNGAFGTPGAQNESCFDYTLERIPVAYQDISLTGVPLFTAGSNVDSETASLDLSAAPFPWFDTAQSTAIVSSNGWVSFKPQTSSYSSNKTKPTTSNPNSLLAPFWDNLDNKDAVFEANIYAERIDPAGLVPGHWIIQWHRFTYATFIIANEDDLNFQVKLFDDGVAEFHYADMINGVNNYANGRTATIWLDNPAGTAALPIGINQPVIQSKTAYRFIPQP